MENELIALEEEGWRALAAGEGAGFYAEHCTDDALMIFPGGMVMDRDAAVQGLRDAPGWAEYTLADWRATPLGDDAGVVVYHAEAARGRGPVRGADVLHLRPRRRDLASRAAPADARLGTSRGEQRSR